MRNKKLVRTLRRSTTPGQSRPQPKPTARAQSQAPAAEAPTPRKTGRPSKYTKAIAEEICERLADGESLRHICDSSGHLPTWTTVANWVRENREGFLTHYARARDIQCELHADQLVEIADGVDEDKAAVDKARLRIQTRQWNLSHLLPKKYGARIALGNADEKPLGIAVEERNRLIDEICRLVQPKADPKTKPDTKCEEERDRRSK